jgi:hypothetical protein
MEHLTIIRLLIGNEPGIRPKAQILHDAILVKGNGLVAPFARCPSFLSSTPLLQEQPDLSQQSCRQSKCRFSPRHTERSILVEHASGRASDWRMPIPFALNPITQGP